MYLIYLLVPVAIAAVCTGFYILILHRKGCWRPDAKLSVGYAFVIPVLLTYCVYNLMYFQGVQEKMQNPFVCYGVAAVFSICTTGISLLLFTGRLAFQMEDRRVTGHKWLAMLAKVCFVLICFVASLLFFASLWVTANFDTLTPSMLFFHLMVPLTGANESFVISFLMQAGLPAFFVSAILSLFALWPARKSVVASWNSKKKHHSSIVLPLLRKAKIPVAAGLLFLSLVFVFNHLSARTFIDYIFSESKFFEQQYVDPVQAGIHFPGKKRNLVYIFLESMETTYMDRNSGGDMETNLIPKLTKLSQENISFSTDNTLNGVRPLMGWTTAAIFSYESGLHYGAPIGNEYNEYASFMPGAHMLGDILDAEGYRQVFLVGSDATFGGKSLMLADHGAVEIRDYPRALEEGRVPADYKAWWGLEDEKLYAWGRETLLELAESGAPFCLELLTVDTHHPGGFMCPLCYDEHGNNYANAISCASRQATDFVTWIQQQDFYENTTVVIVGDHLSMDADFFANVDDDYMRGTVNIIINSAVDTDYTKGRQVAQWDYFPTVLVAIGAEFDGNRLGIGTNLFSQTPTLLEEFGEEYVYQEVSQQSMYYNKHIIYG